MTIYNNNPDDAAAEFIERWDSGGDYVCIGGDEMQVSVAPLQDPEKVQVFTVRGEMVPEYYATELLGMDEQKELHLDAIARGDADDIWKSAHGLSP